ncbi:hypothetical protein [Streptomyces nigra]|uniref:hypothetical protein n=1 Tax=Streptomyces nigra TaxID=1827580 RepID=UPI00382BC385
MSRLPIQPMLANPTLARDEFERWIRAVGNTPEPQVTLSVEEASTVLTTWPTES